MTRYELDELKRAVESNATEDDDASVRVLAAFPELYALAVKGLERRATALKPPLEKVLRYVESPLNASRWSAELACGHSVWVTAKNPTARKRRCSECHKADPRNQ